VAAELSPTPRAYAAISAADPGGFAGHLLAFAEELRDEGMALGTSELLDGFAALRHIAWTQGDDFRESLATTLAKSPEDRRVFEVVFDRFFFRAAEAQAARLAVTEAPAGATGSSDELVLDLEALRRQIAAALQQGDEAALRDLARLAIAAFGRGEGSGVLGVDVQRIRRALGLRTEPQPDLATASRARSCAALRPSCAGSWNGG
jgi:uncharacterized protein with von Willebrand factor type A (vWA) domain